MNASQMLSMPIITAAKEKVRWIYGLRLFSAMCILNHFEKNKGKQEQGGMLKLGVSNAN